MCRLRSLALVALATLLSACASLPSLEGRTATRALFDTDATRLGAAVAPLVASHAGKAGIHAMPDPHDAFAARVLLARTADKSIDAQYYVWHGDDVGYLLFEALWEAAERGVRVRLLLDDLNTEGLDATIAALDAHPNIEVRLYNPVTARDARALNFVTDFARVNRRMHNKSFTVDNQVSVVGGRNIGDEYFGAGTGVGFADLDVIAMGTAVRDVSTEFDLYWNSPSAYPAELFVGIPGPQASADLQARFAATRAHPEAVTYVEAVRSAPLVRALLDRQLEIDWTTATVVYDDPAKTLDTTSRTDVLLFPELVRALGRPRASLDLVSPYFVPGAEGTAALEALAKDIKVRVLTNSLAASDVKAVHAGYAKRRADLLRAGVRLFELKPDAGKATAQSASRFGSSASSALHAKTFAVDGQRIFVGSFNFDQRSALLNTEMGIVIDSPVLAQRLNEFFEARLPREAYEVRLSADGRDLEWLEQTSTGVERYDTDPGTTWFMRRQVDLISILPIEWLL